jgi:hypothetical protein
VLVITVVGLAGRPRDLGSCDCVEKALGEMYGVAEDSLIEHEELVWSGGKVTSSTVDANQVTVQNSGPHLLRPETTWAYDESKGNCLFRTQTQSNGGEGARRANVKTHVKGLPACK